MIYIYLKFIQFSLICSCFKFLDELLSQLVDDQISDGFEDILKFENSEENEPQEKWKNQNIDIKPKSTTRRCKTSILEPIKDSSTLRVLMNANLCKKKKVNSPRLTHNTCSFDTIFQLYAACYSDSSKFKEFADKDTSSEFIKIVKSFCNCERMEVIVKERETLLYSAFDKQVKIQRKFLELACYMSDIDMFIGLCAKNPVLYSMTEKKRCRSCSNHSCTMKTSLPLSCVNLNISSLTTSIHFKDQSKPCEKCDVGMNMEIQRTLNPAVIIDLDGMQNQNISIAKIQQRLILQGEIFQLRGLIETTGNHFIAHALRNDGCWHTFDNIHPTAAKTIPDSTVLLPVFLLYCSSELSLDNTPLDSFSAIMNSKFPIVRVSK